MKTLAPFSYHVLILPLCWALTAACWSFPIWKYSHSTFTFGGEFVDHFSYSSLGLSGPTAILLGFIASIIELVAIAAGLSLLKVSLWIYVVTPIVPVYELLTLQGGGLREYFLEFGRYTSL